MYYIDIIVCDLNKNINQLAVAYRMSAKTLGTNLNVPEWEAQGYIDSLFGQFPVLEKFIKENSEYPMKHNGYINTEKQNVVAYNFDINGDVITYLVKGENELPSLTEIYGESARWAEEEIEELMPVKFTNLNRSRRLILPEDFKEGEGQILVMTLSELKKLKNNKEGEAN